MSHYLHTTIRQDLPSAAKEAGKQLYTGGNHVVHELIHDGIVIAHPPSLYAANLGFGGWDCSLRVDECCGDH